MIFDSENARLKTRAADHVEHRVPFFRPAIGQEELAAVARVMRSGWLTSGPETEAFESEFAAFVGNGVSAVAVNSCTAGLHLALEACGVGPNDEVLVPDLTFTATAEVVRYLGAHPIFIDIDPTTLCIDLSAAVAAITPKTRAIIPVHMAGRAVDLDGLYKLAQRYKLAVIEDAAHALPATYNGELIGGHQSDAVVFSFYANKTLTTGEGGMIVSRDSHLLQRCRAMRLHGIDRSVHDRFTTNSSKWRYDVIAPGFKYNLTDLAAAIGREQLKKTWHLHGQRQEIARFYDDALSELPFDLPPRSAGKDIHAWHIYIVRLRESAALDRDCMLEHLDQHLIGYSVHYRPLHQMSYWKETYRLLDGQFPEATKYFRKCLSLPLFPGMKRSECVRTVRAIEDAFGAKRP
jgi:dTDP-4-amino-4,6-dideoxygalactose transaminase